MRRAARIGLLLVLGAAVPAPAAEAFSVNECLSCHGVTGLRETPAAPFLFGQDPHYLAHQINAFQRQFVGVGTGFTRLDRTHPVMSGEAPKVTREDIPIVAGWFARQPCLDSRHVDGGPAAVPPVPEDAVPCLTCHGDGGRSHKAYVPTLAGQRQAYLTAQLIAFRGRKRDEIVQPGQSRTHAMMTRQGSYLDDAAIAARREACHAPYHAEIARWLDQATAAHAQVAMFAVHSFTPSLRDGDRRPWDTGVLWTDDARIPVPLMATRITPRIDVTAFTPRTDGLPSTLTQVPGCFGLKLLRIRTGIRFRKAVRMVL